MMYQWRITKYDPALRDKNDVFLGDDWIMPQELGKTYKGGKLTLTPQEYLKVEGHYVQAAMAFFKQSGVAKLTVKDLQNVKAVPEEIEKHGLNEKITLHEGQQLGADDIANTVRMMLRELEWCRLEAPDKFFIHIGWDYYMYIGCEIDLPQAIAETERLGLYVEACESPYVRHLTKQKETP